MPAEAKLRRTQEERTAHTRQLLIDATIEAIHRVGYNGASTALIAQIAGVSRGSILHQYGTRAALMAEVVKAVFEQEMGSYNEILQAGEFGHRVDDWPRILWSVLSRPSGVAVLEILQAAQSEEELADHVRVMQLEVERGALAMMRMEFGGDEATAQAVMRLMVWAVRGLTIADRVMPGGADPLPVVNLLSLLLRNVSATGRLDEISRLVSGADGRENGA